MFKDGLILVAEFLVEKIRAELLAQDHNASGDLISSIRYMVTENQIIIIANDYAKYLETGTSAGRWVPIDALIRWIEQKGIASGEREVKNAAFAIQRAIFREGTPTKGSYKFSKNGRRKEFLTFVMDENFELIVAKITEVLSTLVVGEINNAITKEKVNFETI